MVWTCYRRKKDKAYGGPLQEKGFTTTPIFKCRQSWAVIPGLEDAGASKVSQDSNSEEPAVYTHLGQRALEQKAV